MPNKKSAAKELRKALKRSAQNKKVLNRLKDSVKICLKQIKAGDKNIKEDYKKTIKAIDKAAKKGVIKKNTAARKKSKLMKKINAFK